MSPVDSLRTETKFKKTEIGEIPVDWELVKLGDYCEVLGGSTPSTKKPEYWNGDIPWAIPRDITKLKGNVIENTEKKITEGGLANSAAKILPAGSILLTSRATIGECAINSRPMATNQGFANLVCRKDIHNWFLLYRLKFIRKELENLSSGSTFREISKRSIREMRISLPPFIEQKKIAEILAATDEAIEKKQEIIEKTTELKKGLMQKLITHGIGHTKFKKTEIGTIPEDWQVVKLKDVAAKQKYAFVDGPFGSNLKSVHYVTQGIPVIQSRSIISGRYEPVNTIYISGQKAKELERSKVMPGDIVIAKIGVNYGASATIPSNHAVAILSGNTMKITLDANKVKPEFLQYELHYLRMIKAFDKIVSTTAQPAITLEGTKNLKISLPKLEEQERIANMLIAVDDILNNKTANQIKLEEIKSGLMQNLLTGKIRITL